MTVGADAGFEARGGTGVGSGAGHGGLFLKMAKASALLPDFLAPTSQCYHRFPTNRENIEFHFVYSVILFKTKRSLLRWCYPAFYVLPMNFQKIIH